jgi:hypothetical protein
VISVPSRGATYPNVRSQDFGDTLAEAFLARSAGHPAPKSAPPVDWPVGDEKKAEGISFIIYLNAMLPFMPTVIGVSKFWPSVFTITPA